VTAPNAAPALDGRYGPIVSRHAEREPAGPAPGQVVQADDVDDLVDA
jgi:hypothetical protein